MIDLSRPFSLPSHPARAYLLQKGVYSLLAFDLWLTMVSHGARYGMGGFNVTHLGFLDRFVPVPSAAFYVGLLLLTGLLALLQVLSGGARFLRVAVTVLYTTSWLISLFDSYQHHYLLSWLLLWTVFMPDVQPESARKRDVALAAGWGVPMTAITCGIVYAFTAISKSEPDWRAGHVLVRLSHSQPPGDQAPGVLDGVRDLLMSWLSLPEYVAWAYLAQSVIALQIVACVAYFAASGRDAAPSRFRAIACSLGLLATLSFHAFAELGHMFDIGWFSYYMLWIACVMLSPAPAVAWLARVVSGPSHALNAWFERSASEASVGAALAQVVSAAVLLLVSGYVLALPGALAAGVIAAVLVLGWGLVQVRLEWLESAQRLAFASALTAVACFVAITASDVRYDYYRRAGGELRGLGQLPEALTMYRQAERFAGPGQSRRAQIAELERMIRAGARDSD